MNIEHNKSNNSAERVVSYLDEHYDEDELRALASELRIEFEGLREKNAKGLVQCVLTKGRLNSLIAAIRRYHSDF